MEPIALRLLVLVLALPAIGIYLLIRRDMRNDRKCGADQAADPG